MSRQTNGIEKEVPEIDTMCGNLLYFRDELYLKVEKTCFFVNGFGTTD